MRWCPKRRQVNHHHIHFYQTTPVSRSHHSTQVISDQLLTGREHTQAGLLKIARRGCGGVSPLTPGESLNALAAWQINGGIRGCRWRCFWARLQFSQSTMHKPVNSWINKARWCNFSCQYSTLSLQLTITSLLIYLLTMLMINYVVSVAVLLPLLTSHVCGLTLNLYQVCDFNHSKQTYVTAAPKPRSH